VFEVRQTTLFAEWHRALKDKKAAKAIASRLLRLQSGLFGDVQRGNVLIVVLRGGVKRTQQADIHEAKILARTV